MKDGSASRETERPADRASTRVLVVDDDPASVKMLRRILTEGGYEQVRTSTDPGEVVGLCESGEFDLLLLDLTMPDLDGFEVLAALGGRLRGDPPLRVVVLTGHEHPAITHRAAALGARAVIGKTTPRDELLASLDSVIATHRGNETSSH